MSAIGRNYDMWMLPIVRCTLLAASSALIVGGWYLSATPISVAGAIVYAISSVMSYVAGILVMARFRDDPNSGARELKKYNSRTASLLAVAIFLLGLGGVIYGSSNKNETDVLFSLPGVIIWWTEFCMYSLHGVVCEKFLGVRLTLRPYQGWQYVGRCKRVE